METLGGPGAGLAIAAENLFPPIPSEAILPLAGFAAAQGVMSLWSAIIWTTVGSVVGALALYAVGRIVGRDRLVAVVDRLPLVDVADVERTEQWFARHGEKAVLFGRMLPLFRSLISIPAGLAHMPVWRFTVLTAVGSLAWNTLFIVAGYQLGQSWHRIEPWSGALEKVVIAAVVVAVAVFVVRRLRRTPVESVD